MPQKIILVRHGETDYNKERRIQGWLDIPLNVDGHKQAQEVAKKLTIHQPHAIYTSDLTRAVETADHIAKELALYYQATPNLRETDMGVFAGWRWESERNVHKDRLWQKFQEARDRNDREWREHGGESNGQGFARIESFLADLHARHSEQVVVLVTHGGTINKIFEHFRLKETSEGFRMHGNTSVNIFLKNGHGYELITHNDVTHL
jgi:probable phosphoglycerate mutase